MTAQTRTVNKGRFENGDKPQGSDYVDLIDSFLSIADTSAQSVASHVTFSAGLATTTVSADAAKITTLDVTTGSAAAMSTADLTAANVSAQTAFASAQTASKIRVGPSTPYGDVIVRQKATVTFASTVKATAFSLPNGADILEIHVYTTDPFTTTGNQDLKIGTAADDTYFASVPLSAGGKVRATPTSAVRWLAVSGATARILVMVTAASTVAVSGQAVLEVVYAGAF